MYNTEYSVLKYECSYGMYIRHKFTTKQYAKLKYQYYYYTPC